MRILTLLAGENSLASAVDLTREISSFNAEIDFRLRFLHVEIEEVHVVEAQAQDAVQKAITPGRLVALDGADPLEDAARLALLIQRERPDVTVVVGDGPLAGPGAAAARVCDVKMAVYAASEPVDGAMELGNDAAVAVERLTGVAREIR